MAKETKSYKGSPYWWIRRPKYVAIFLRELGSFFNVFYVIALIVGLVQLRSGVEAYRSYLNLISSPPFVLLNILFAAFAVYHTLTWFNLFAKIQPIKIGKRNLPTGYSTVVSIVVWLIVSYFVGVIFFG